MPEKYETHIETPTGTLTQSHIHSHTLTDTHIHTLIYTHTYTHTRAGMQGMGRCL